MTYVTSPPFCNSCQINLCVECIHKHIDKLQSLSHDIVHLKNRKIELMLPKCNFHPGKICEVHCQQCQIPICIRCCIDAHKNHDAVELAEFDKIRKQEIKSETDEIEARIIPQNNNTDADLQDKLTKTTTEYARLVNEKDRHREIWHKQVNKIFVVLDFLIQDAKHRNVEGLNAYRTKIKNLTQDMI